MTFHRSRIRRQAGLRRREALLLLQRVLRSSLLLTGCCLTLTLTLVLLLQRCHESWQDDYHFYAIFTGPNFIGSKIVPQVFIRAFHGS